MATQTIKIGTGPFFLLFLVFLTLKLTDHIDWSWWLVTLPLWWPLGLMVMAMIGVLICALAVASVDPLEDVMRKLNSKKRK